MADEARHGDGGRDEQHDDQPRHDELDDHDPPARDRLGEEVDDRAVVELGPDGGRADDDRDERQEDPDPEVAEQPARDVQRLGVARAAEAEQHVASTSSTPTSASSSVRRRLRSARSVMAEERRGHRRTR